MREHPTWEPGRSTFVSGSAMLPVKIGKSLEHVCLIGGFAESVAFVRVNPDQRLLTIGPDCFRHVLGLFGHDHGVLAALKERHWPPDPTGLSQR